MLLYTYATVAHGMLAESLLAATLTGIKQDMIPRTTLNMTLFVKLSYAFRP